MKRFIFILIGAINLHLAAAAWPGEIHPVAAVASSPKKNALWFYQFTNELGRPVSLDQFRGQALAVTFIYTRCPLPDACPRASKNFEEATQKLSLMAHLSTNWHFITFTFDPAFDTPTVLKRYGEQHNYNPAHWSFLTGAPGKIAELARLSDVKYEGDHGFYNHNLRTLIVDGDGHLQNVFPVSGNLSDAIVSEMIKALNAHSTNSPPSSALAQRH